MHLRRGACQRSRALLSLPPCGVNESQGVLLRGVRETFNPRNRARN